MDAVKAEKPRFSRGPADVEARARLHKNVMANADDYKRKAVDRVAWRVIKPAHPECAPPPEAPTIIERPKPACEKTVAKMMLDAARHASLIREKQKTAPHKRSNHGTVSLRKRARTILFLRGVRNPTKAEIKAAMKAVSTGDGRYLASPNQPLEQALEPRTVPSGCSEAKR